MSAPTLRTLAERLRETLELDSLEVDESGTVELIVGSELKVRIQELPELNCLVFTAGLGSIPGDKPAADVYRALLQANFHGSLTVGGSLSLSLDPNPEVELIVRESLAGMEYERFEAVLEDFINCAEYWADYLAGASPETNPPEGSTDTPLNTDIEFVRV